MLIITLWSKRADSFPVIVDSTILYFLE